MVTVNKSSLFYRIFYKLYNEVYEEDPSESTTTICGIMTMPFIWVLANIVGTVAILYMSIMTIYYLGQGIAETESQKKREYAIMEVKDFIESSLDLSRASFYSFVVIVGYCCYQYPWAVIILLWAVTIVGFAEEKYGNYIEEATRKTEQEIQRTICQKICIPVKFV